METKTIVQFQRKERKVWLKDMGERNNTNFVLLAETPDNEVFYASSIKSDLFEQHEKNQIAEVEGIALVKPKREDGKFLQVLFGSGKILDLKNENYCLFFHFPNPKNDSVDCVLIFNFPSMLGKGTRFQIFLSDKDNQNAMALFWLLKDFILEEEEAVKDE